MTKSPDGLKELIPLVGNTEERLKELENIFFDGYNEYSTQEVVDIVKSFYRFLYNVLIDDIFNDYFNDEGIFWRWLNGVKFRKFPRIERGDNYNKSFHCWLRDSVTGLKMDILRFSQARRDETEIQLFETERDEAIDEKSEIMSYKICLTNIYKITFTSCGHCACFSCSNKYKNCRICRKGISKKIKIL